MALGDSVPYGLNCDGDNYVTLVAQGVANQFGKDVSIDNLAVPGETSAECVADVAQTAAVISSLKQAHLVIIQIGANDFNAKLITDDACYPAENNGCWSSDLTAMSDNLVAIIDSCRSLVPNIPILLVGYWNIVADGVVGRSKGDNYPRNSDSLTKVVNAELALIAAEKDAAFVDTYVPMKGADGSTDITGLLASDGDHPNAAGHTIIAKACLQALHQPK